MPGFDSGTDYVIFANVTGFNTDNDGRIRIHERIVMQDSWTTGTAIDDALITVGGLIVSSGQAVNAFRGILHQPTLQYNTAQAAAAPALHANATIQPTVALTEGAAEPMGFNSTLLFKPDITSGTHKLGLLAGYNAQNLAQLATSGDLTVTNWVGYGTHLDALGGARLGARVTATTFRHFVANQPTINASAVIGRQVGFEAASFTNATSDNIAFLANGGGDNRFAGNVRIGDTAKPTATLDVRGGHALGIATKTASYAMTTADFAILADATAAAITITLAGASSATGLLAYITKADAGVNVVTVAAATNNSIEGASTVLLATQYTNRLFLSDGSSTWYRIT